MINLRLRKMIYLSIASVLTIPLHVRAEEPLEGIRPTPLTRPEMKRMLEDVKHRTPRIPLPELTDGDREVLGEQIDNYESRVRHHYLNGIEPPRGPRISGTSSSRQQDPLFTLDAAFKVELFWIVSRVNNCQYCIGHQESKLLGLGRTEDQIAMLDSEWDRFSPSSQEAFAFARKFTLEPHLLSDSDIERLKSHFTDDQILEMMLSMAGNNSINRWKEAIAVPQHAHGGGFSMGSGSRPQNEPSDPSRPSGTYETPTSPGYAKKLSQIVLVNKPEPNAIATATFSQRPKLESREEVKKKFLECASRRSRISLIDESLTHERIPPSVAYSNVVPNWIRLLARFPTAGGSRIATTLAAEEKGDLSPLLKAQMAWILARQDRAWYAMNEAFQKLTKLNQSEDQIFALDGDWKEFPEREQALFDMVKKLGDAPVVLSAKEVKRAVEVAGPRDVVQAISYTTTRAAFNRITEAAGLPADLQARSVQQ